MVTLARWTQDQTGSHYEAVKNNLDAKAAGAAAVLPAWSPRMAFGVMASKSAVAIRNVRIIPLPRPL